MSRTTAATEAVQRYAAERAVDDPVKLARAARITRAALARQRLRLADLAPAPDAPTGEERD
jgi:hypothetical protein